MILNISEIAIITGDNKFKTKRDFLLDYWKKSEKEDFKKYQNLTSFIKENDEEIIDKISKSNSIDIQSDLQLCKKSRTINDLNEHKKNIMRKINELPPEEKREIEKSITNVTNTKFGIKNEFDVLKLYELKTGTSIIKDNIFRKRQILNYKLANDNEKQIQIYIGGKIDGINNDNGCIIEIKNRIHKLFYDLRDYEKVQLMCYIYLFDKKSGHLVEAIKKNDGTIINIIELEYDEKYMNNIIDKIYNFVRFYMIFLENHELKLIIMKNKNEINF